MNNMNQMNMHGNMGAAPGGGGVGGAPPGIGMHSMVPAGAMMQQPSPQQMPQQMQPGPGPAAAPLMPQQQQQQQPPQQDKMDSISKVKTLMAAMREAVPAGLKSAAQILHQNNALDTNSQKAIGENTIQRAEKNLEEFFSLCDQMELHLRTAMACVHQAQSSSHYLPLTVIPSRLDPTPAQETTLSYPQFLNTVRSQISYAKDIHDTLVAAAQNMSPNE